MASENASGIDVKNASLTLPDPDFVFDYIEKTVVSKGYTITAFIRSQRLAESTWHRWRSPDPKKRQQARYDALKDLTDAANRLRPLKP